MNKPIKIEPGCQMPEEGQAVFGYVRHGRVWSLTGNLPRFAGVYTHWLPMPPAPNDWLDTVEVSRKALADLLSDVKTGICIFMASDEGACWECSCCFEEAARKEDIEHLDHCLVTRLRQMLFEEGEGE
jgi:hypothetical protein